MFSRLRKASEAVGHIGNAWTFFGLIGWQAKISAVGAGMLAWVTTFFGAAGEGLPVTAVWVLSLVAGLVVAWLVLVCAIIVSMLRIQAPATVPQQGKYKSRGSAPAKGASARSNSSRPDHPHPSLVLRIDIETKMGTSTALPDRTFFLTEIGSWIVLKNLTDRPIAFKIQKWSYAVQNTSNPVPEMLNVGNVIYANDEVRFKLPAAIMTPPLLFVPTASRYTFSGKIAFDLLYGTSPEKEDLPLSYEAVLKIEVWSEGQKLNCLTTATRIEKQNDETAKA